MLPLITDIFPKIFSQVISKWTRKMDFREPIHELIVLLFSELQLHRTAKILCPVNLAHADELPFFVLRVLWISPVQVSLADCSAVYQPGSTSRALVQVLWPSAGFFPTVLRERSMLQLCPRVLPGLASAQLWPEFQKKKSSLHINIYHLKCLD